MHDLVSGQTMRRLFEYGQAASHTGPSVPRILIAISALICLKLTQVVAITHSSRSADNCLSMAKWTSLLNSSYDDRVLAEADHAAKFSRRRFPARHSDVQQGMTESSQELADIQQRLAKAWVRGDRTAIEHIIAQDWTVTGADGRVSTRADVLRDAFETKVHRIRAIEIDDVRVRVFGDAAVVTGRTHGRGEYGNVPYDVTIRFTDVFVRREARWQAVASHASLLTARKQ